MLRKVFGIVAFTVPVTVTILDVFGYVAQVEGISMQPILNPVGSKKNDYVLLSRWNARKLDFERGQIVSVISPTDPDQQLIKRIVALSGDKVRTLSYKHHYVRIPDGYCWLEGDRHDRSMDSNVLGPIPVGLIQATASLIVWPPERWQRLKIIATRDRVSVAHKVDSESDSQ